MKTNNVTTTQMPKVCELQMEYGKLKVEQKAENPIQRDRSQRLHPASPVLAEALRGHDGHNAQPSYSDDEKRTPNTQANMENATMKDTFENSSDTGKAHGFAVDQERKRSVEIDVAYYQAYLDDPSLSDHEKAELVNALASIITAFVDFGYGVHPMQKVGSKELCGKVAEFVDAQADQDSNGNKPDFENLCTNFNAASRDT